jgi:F-type H+-transporting ATPase subunit c
LGKNPQEEKMPIKGTVIQASYPIAVAIAAIGSGLGLGRAVGSAMEAMGRQPEAAGKIQTGMIVGAAFIEALTIYALITVFLVPK